MSEGVGKKVAEGGKEGDKGGDAGEGLAKAPSCTAPPTSTWLYATDLDSSDTDESALYDSSAGGALPGRDGQTVDAYVLVGGSQASRQGIGHQRLTQHRAGDDVSGGAGSAGPRARVWKWAGRAAGRPSAENRSGVQDASQDSAARSAALEWLKAHDTDKDRSGSGSDEGLSFPAGPSHDDSDDSSDEGALYGLGIAGAAAASAKSSGQVGASMASGTAQSAATEGAVASTATAHAPAVQSARAKATEEEVELASLTSESEDASREGAGSADSSDDSDGSSDEGVLYGSTASGTAQSAAAEGEAASTATALHLDVINEAEFSDSAATDSESGQSAGAAHVCPSTLTRDEAELDAAVRTPHSKDAAEPTQAQQPLHEQNNAQNRVTSRWSEKRRERRSRREPASFSFELEAASAPTTTVASSSRSHEAEAAVASIATFTRDMAQFQPGPDSSENVTVAKEYLDSVQLESMVRIAQAHEETREYVEARQQALAHAIADDKAKFERIMQCVEDESKKREEHLAAIAKEIEALQEMEQESERRAQAAARERDDAAAGAMAADAAGRAANADAKRRREELERRLREVEEDRRRRSIFYAHAPPAAKVAFCLDITGSMHCHLREGIAGVKDSIRSMVVHHGEAAEFIVVAYRSDGRATAFGPADANGTSVKSAAGWMAGLSTRNGTYPYEDYGEALALSMAKLPGLSEVNFFSDQGANCDQRVLDQAKAANITINVVLLGCPANSTVNEMCSSTGGVARQHRSRSAWAFGYS